MLAGALALVLLFTGCATTENAQPSPQQIAQVVADQLDLVVIDLDLLKASFPENDKMQRILADARAVVGVIVAQAKAFAASEQTADVLQNAMLAAQTSLRELVASDVLSGKRAESVRVALLVAQLALNHALPALQAAKS